MIKYTDIVVWSVVFAVGFQVEQEILSLFEVQSDGEFVARTGVELGVLEFEGLKTRFGTAPVGHAIGEVINKAWFSSSAKAVRSTSSGMCLCS